MYSDKMLITAVGTYYILHLQHDNNASLHLPPLPPPLLGLYPNHQTTSHYENNMKSSSESRKRMEPSQPQLQLQRQSQRMELLLALLLPDPLLRLSRLRFLRHRKTEYRLPSGVGQFNLVDSLLLLWDLFAISNPNLELDLVDRPLLRYVPQPHI